MTLENGILSTPFGRFIQIPDGRWQPIDANYTGGVMEPLEEDVSPTYPTNNPATAFTETANYMDPEVMRVKRVAWGIGAITIAHADWRTLNELSASEQAAFALDIYKLSRMQLPFLQDGFNKEHAQIVKSVFPNRAIFFNGSEVE